MTTKHEVLWKPFDISFHGLHKHLGLNPIQSCQVLIKHDLLAADGRIAFSTRSIGVWTSDFMR